MRFKKTLIISGEEDNEEPFILPGWGQRHTLALLGFWAFAISYAMRFNLSIAIVAMVNTTKGGNGNGGGGGGGEIGERATISDLTGNYTYLGKDREEACLHLIQNDSLSDSKNGGGGHDGEFQWNSVEQGIILGSFFWGYGKENKIKNFFN